MWLLCTPPPQGSLIPTQDTLLLIIPGNALTLALLSPHPQLSPSSRPLLSDLVSLPSDRLSAHPTDTRSPLRYVWPQLAEECTCWTLRGFEEYGSSKMGTDASEKQAEQKVRCAFQASEEAHGTLATATPWVAVGSAYGSCTCLGA